MRPLLDVFPDRLAVGGGRILVQQPALVQGSQHHRQATGILEVLHEEAAGRHEIDEAVDPAAELAERFCRKSGLETRGDPVLVDSSCGDQIELPCE